MFKCCVLIVSICLLCTGLHAAETRYAGIFYQPLARDIGASSEDWGNLLWSVKADGINHIVFQWSQFGEQSFVGRDSTIERVLSQLEIRNMGFTLGLAMPANYYHVMEHSDAQTKQIALQKWLQQNVQFMLRMTVAGFPQRQGFQGWYLPLEISETYVDGELLAIWQNGLAHLLRETPYNVSVSYFPSANGEFNRFAQINDALAHPRLTLMVQIPSGVSDTDVRSSIIQLPCKAAVVVENFTQTSAIGQPFTADKAALPTLASQYDCQKAYIFSLRYQAYSHFLPLQDF
ncbi:DUF4434 domain-containing protein [Alteromonas sp. ASW11-36]|uniref:DUF4434 domain-containing protein n=1 Tax=Alteromonas arenosi TaxID=3055817 RepID=A0ABT7SUL3_9ALTE|nr:DUF4434 domain-containing protein [Alteromonas sp. ASW11-36]MDM7859883.1 DUF4434 domain-containing protein [Alteromonas sp. ASW11-36]